MESEDEDCKRDINKFMRLVFQKFKESLRHEKTNFKTPEEKRRKGTNAERKEIKDQTTLKTRIIEHPRNLKKNSKSLHILGWQLR